MPVVTSRSSKVSSGRSSQISASQSSQLGASRSGSGRSPQLASGRTSLVNAGRASLVNAGRSSQVGRRVGPFTLCMELASGGMATVFLARATAVEAPARLVALKLFHPHLAGQQDFAEMFSDEARIGSLLHHPNLCQVFEFGAADDTYYLAMEHLNGEPLSAVFRRTARRATRLEEHAASIVRIVADACEGLHAAHVLQGPDGKPLNLVHRDISPENLFVTYSGVTKVVDFGLVGARIQTHRTRTGIIKGKYAYVSPEALRGVKVDRRADVFSLGVVVWELLTGRRLFRRSTDLETLGAVAQAPIPAPSSVRPGLPVALDAPVLRALSRDPGQRQRSAASFAEDLLKACAPAALLTEADVAEWMSQLFPDERRWKTQVIELIEALSNVQGGAVAPESAPGVDVPARASPAPVPTPARSGVHLLRRRAPLATAGLLAAIVAALAMAHSPTLAEAEARTSTVQGPFNRSARSSDQTPLFVPASGLGPALARDASAPFGAGLQSLELPKDGSYVLEIADGPDGKKLLILRVHTGSARGAARLHAGVASVPVTAPVPAVAEAGAGDATRASGDGARVAGVSARPSGAAARSALPAPPFWLRQRLERERQRRWADVDVRVRAEAAALAKRAPKS